MHVRVKHLLLHAFRIFLFLLPLESCCLHSFFFLHFLLFPFKSSLAVTCSRVTGLTSCQSPEDTLRQSSSTVFQISSILKPQWCTQLQRDSYLLGWSAFYMPAHILPSANSPAINTAAVGSSSFWIVNQEMNFSLL